MGEFVSVDHTANIAIVQIDRPKVNALNVAVLNEIESAFTDLNKDLPRSVLLWGGPNVFSAGADIDELGTPEAAAKVADAFRGATAAIENLPRVVVAAVAGFALGGGLEVALAADIRIGTRSAYFGVPEVKLGVVPGGGASARLPQLIGEQAARYLLLTGEHIDASMALDWHLIDAIAENSTFYEEAHDLAQKFAAGPASAHAAIKNVLRTYRFKGFDACLEEEKKAFSEIFNTSDAQVGLEAFRSKSTALFRGE